MAEQNHDDIADALEALAQGKHPEDEPASEGDAAPPSRPPAPVVRRPAIPQSPAARPAAPARPAIPARPAAPVRQAAPARPAAAPPPRPAAPPQRVRPATPGSPATAPQPVDPFMESSPSAPELAAQPIDPFAPEPVAADDAVPLTDDSCAPQPVDQAAPGSVPTAPAAPMEPPAWTARRLAANYGFDQRNPEEIRAARSLRYKQTITPVLLTLGLLLPLLTVMLGAGSEPYELPLMSSGMQVGLVVAGAICLVLGILNVLMIRSELKRRPTSRQPPGSRR